MKAMNLSLLIAAALLATACGQGSTTYSLLAEGQTFQQNSAMQLTKIDVLWVVDNSGSMASSQQNLANNFPSFIQKFTEKSYDFQMGVTTTDAYLALPTWTPYYNTSPTPSYYGGRPQAEIGWLRDGTWTDPSGFRIMNLNTPNLNQVFMKNAMQGINGRGDERSLQSMTTALSSAGNAGFVRDQSFLAVILLTDEDDFSHDGTAQYERYDRPLTPIADYVTYLDNLTHSSGANRRYTVNSIAVNDQACLDSIYNGAQKIGLRVGEMTDATGGVKASICGNFANELSLIAKSIVELSTQFYLSGDPVPESIRVYVNGSEIPRTSENPAGNGGFTYNEAAHSVVFQGIYVPPQGANINVTFDPRTINF
jgi:hypothetical protein